MFISNEKVIGKALDYGVCLTNSLPLNIIHPYLTKLFFNN